MLSFSSVLLNENITGESAETLHKVVDLGDTTDSGSVGGQDAFDISRVVVHLDTGFAADPLVDPVVIGDLTGDGTLSGVDATDASLMFTNPASQPQVPAPVQIIGGALAGLDPTVQTGLGSLTTLDGNAGSNVIAGIQISDDASGLDAADLIVTYDPTLLTLTDANVALSSYLNSQGWGMTESIPTAGTLRVSVFSESTGLPSGPASLLDLTFAAGLTDGVSQLGVQTGSSLNKGKLTMSTDVGSVAVTSALNGEHVFYAGSSFDAAGNGNNPDDNAIATDKKPLFFGQTATFANYTSYADGLNGLMVDIIGTVGTITSSDFEFSVGGTGPDGNDLSTWSTLAGPAPTVTTRATPGVAGSTRVELVFANNEIQNQWLEITVLANADTGLAQNETFFFGNAIGETGDSATDALVTDNDEAGARNNQTSFFSGRAAITDPYDFNRDGNVDATDQIIARANETTAADGLDLISPTAPAGPAIAGLSFDLAPAGNAAGASDNADGSAAGGTGLGDGLASPAILISGVMSTGTGSTAGCPTVPTTQQAGSLAVLSVISSGHVKLLLVKAVNKAAGSGHTAIANGSAGGVLESGIKPLGTSGKKKHGENLLELLGGGSLEG